MLSTCVRSLVAASLYPDMSGRRCRRGHAVAEPSLKRSSAAISVGAFGQKASVAANSLADAAAQKCVLASGKNATPAALDVCRLLHFCLRTSLQSISQMDYSCCKPLECLETIEGVGKSWGDVLTSRCSYELLLEPRLSRSEYVSTYPPNILTSLSVLQGLQSRQSFEGFSHERVASAF